MDEFLGRASLPALSRLPDKIKLDYKADKHFHDWLTQQLRRYNIRLKKHQVSAVQFMLDNQNAICADEMGLGKSFSAIATVIAGNYKKAVIVCPASLRDNWAKELEKFGVHKNQIFEASSTKKSESYFTRFDTGEENKSKYSVDDLTEAEKDSLWKLYKKNKNFTFDDALEAIIKQRNKKKNIKDVEAVEVTKLDEYTEEIWAKTKDIAEMAKSVQDLVKKKKVTAKEANEIADELEKRFIEYTSLKGFLAGEGEAKQFAVMSYNLFSKLGEEVKSYNPEIILFDEAHFLKNENSQRALTALDLRDELFGTKFLLLTGTPITGQYSDLVSLLKLVEATEEEINKVKEFAEELNKLEKHEKSKAKKKKEIDMTEIEKIFTDLAYILQRYVIRRRKEQVLDLPKKIIRHVWLSLTPQEREEYNNALKAYEEETGKDFTNSRAKGMVQTLKWRQYASKIKVHKIVPFLQLLLDKNLKIVIFASFKETIEELKSAFGDLAVVFDGSTSKIERQRNQDLFQKYDKRVIIANIKTAAQGFTWTSGTEAIFIDIDWTPTTHRQAMDRLHRIGQDKTVFVYYFLIRDTVEETVFLKNFAKEEKIKTYLHEKNPLTDSTAVEFNELKRLTENRKDNNEKFKDYDKLFNEFVRIANLYIDNSPEKKSLEELRKEIEEWERKGRKATRKRKQLERGEFNLDSLFVDEEKHIARLYISTTAKKPARRAFVTFQPDRASNEWKTGERQELTYKGFYIYYLEEKQLKECQQAIKDLIKLSDSIENMLSGYRIKLENAENNRYILNRNKDEVKNMSDDKNKLDGEKTKEKLSKKQKEYLESVRELYKFNIFPKGFKFNREEANER